MFVLSNIFLLLCLPFWRLLKLPSSGNPYVKRAIQSANILKGMSSVRSAENQPRLRDINIHFDWGKVLGPKWHKIRRCLEAVPLNHRKSEPSLCSDSTGQPLKAWCISFDRRRQSSCLRHVLEFVHHLLCTRSPATVRMLTVTSTAVVDKKTRSYQCIAHTGKSHKLGTDR